MHILLSQEKIMTHGNQLAKTIFDVKLNEKNSSTHVTSPDPRFAIDSSEQLFYFEKFVWK